MSKKILASFDEEFSEDVHVWQLQNDTKVFLNKAYIQPDARKQIEELSRNPTLSHLRFMPDTHVGHCCAIGMSSHLTESVQPILIGSDIGCGISAYPLYSSEDSGIIKDAIELKLQDLKTMDMEIRQVVPVGNAFHSKAPNIDYKVIYTASAQLASIFAKNYETKFGIDIAKHIPKYSDTWFKMRCKTIGADSDETERSMCTLGGGNHFIEISRDVDSSIPYLIVHCGSRTFGGKICAFHTHKTASLKGVDAYAYFFDMIFCQQMAHWNRIGILQAILKQCFGGSISASRMIESVHNYIDFSDLMVRKGAIACYRSRPCLISLNMRDGIVVARPNSQAQESGQSQDWNYSAPHGLGRNFGRAEASSKLSFQEFQDQMQGVYSTSVVQQTLDESPMAYKSPSLVLNAIKDYVELLQHLKPILNIKALS